MNLVEAAMKWGIHAYKSENMQICYRIFKVCIVPPRCENIGICAEVLAAGTPLLCHTSLARKMKLGEENGVLAFSSWDEAFQLADLLCRKHGGEISFANSALQKAGDLEKNGGTGMEMRGKIYFAE